MAQFAPLLRGDRFTLAIEIHHPTISVRLGPLVGLALWQARTVDAARITSGCKIASGTTDLANLGVDSKLVGADTHPACLKIKCPILGFGV